MPFCADARACQKLKCSCSLPEAAECYALFKPRPPYRGHKWTGQQAHCRCCGLTSKANSGVAA
eukprot:2151861-Lingulodinium_polyedra.AAC.1